MKLILLISLLMYSLSEVLFLEKYSETISLSPSGCICLPLSEFEMDESINLVFSANNGDVSNYIYYGYSNIDDPTEATCDEIAVNKEVTHSTGYVTVYNEVETSTTLHYYYHIDKKKDDKYMLIKYEDFIGKYLSIENSRFNINWGIFVVIIVFSFIGLVFLIVILIRYKDYLTCKICEKEKKISSDFINYTQTDTLTAEIK